MRLRETAAFLFLASVLLGAVPALADETRANSAGTERYRLEGRGATSLEGLSYRLPSAAGSVVTGEIKLRGRLVLGERRTTAAGLSLVRFFDGYRPHLEVLRRVDAREPGSVRLQIFVNGEVAVDSPLSEYPTLSTSESRDGLSIRSGLTMQNEQSSCEAACDQSYAECMSSCDPMGQGCEDCWRYFNDCTAACPTCDDWREVSRTLVGRFRVGSANIVGAMYCIFEEHYLVEQTNPAGCHANRFVCKTDTDRIFLGFGNFYPEDEDCCNDNPGDENYCGGQPCS